jgi:hypothetical protein
MNPAKAVPPSSNCLSSSRFSFYSWEFYLLASRLGRTVQTKPPASLIFPAFKSKKSMDLIFSSVRPADRQRAVGPIPNTLVPNRHNVSWIDDRLVESDVVFAPKYNLHLMLRNLSGERHPVFGTFDKE